MEMTWRGEAMVGVMSARTARVHQDYLDQLAVQDDSCPFCKPGGAELVRTTDHHHLIRNKFPYAVWDGREVEAHLMLVPRLHHTTMSTMNDEEHRELFALLREFEPAGYSSYTRSTGNASRSQAHVHTHLIKVTAYAELRAPLTAVPDLLSDQVAAVPHTLTA